MQIDAYPNFPAELKSLNQWVVWRLEERDSKPTKVPYDASTGTKASSTRPDTWVSYAEATQATGYHGVGLVISAPYVGIDLDNVRDPDTGKVEPWAETIIRNLNSYTELSPSECGFHIWVRGTLPPGGNRRGRMEMYGGGRYFTVTGERIGLTPLTVESRDLAALHAQMLAGDVERTPTAKPANKTTGSRIIQTKNGTTITTILHTLLHGDVSGGNGNAFCVEDENRVLMYPSHSEADDDLCRQLAYKYGDDTQQIDDEFRKSPLYRDKWNRQDYRQNTMRRGIEWAKQHPRSPETVETTVAIDEPEDANAAIEPIETIPSYPSEIIEGDYIGELAIALTDGTFIPPQFARENIKTILGSIVDGKIGFPSHVNIHARQYNMNVSVHPESGKGESWCRTGDSVTGFLHGLLAEHDITVLDGGLFGSGEYTARLLSENPRSIGRFDEMSELLEKDKVQASILEKKLLEVFDGNSIAQGSFKNGESSSNDVHFSLAGDFTRDGFENAFAGRGSRGSGFLSRCVLCLADKTPHAGDWNDIDTKVTDRILKDIRTCLALLNTDGAQKQFVPVEDADAKTRRLEFFKYLDTQDPRYTPRLKAHMKRDLMLRALFSADKRIDLQKTNRSIQWAQNQLECRTLLWPEDAGGLVERMERRIIATLTKHPVLSDRELVKHCNVNRPGSGGREVYKRAIGALLYGSREIQVMGQTRKGVPMYGLSHE